MKTYLVYFFVFFLCVTLHIAIVDAHKASTGTNTDTGTQSVKNEGDKSNQSESNLSEGNSSTNSNKKTSKKKVKKVKKTKKDKIKEQEETNTNDSVNGINDNSEKEFIKKYYTNEKELQKNEGESGEVASEKVNEKVSEKVSEVASQLGKEKDQNVVKGENEEEEEEGEEEEEDEENEENSQDDIEVASKTPSSDVNIETAKTQNKNVNKEHSNKASTKEDNKASTTTTTTQGARATTKRSSNTTTNTASTASSTGTTTTKKTPNKASTPTSTVGKSQKVNEDKQKVNKKEEIPKMNDYDTKKPDVYNFLDNDENDDDDDDSSDHDDLTYLWNQNMKNFEPTTLLTFEIGANVEEFLFEEIEKLNVYFRGLFYSNDDHDENEIEFIISDPDGQTVYRKEASEGIFYFYTKKIGIYTIIIKNHKWIEKKTITVAIGLGKSPSLKSDHVKDFTNYIEKIVSETNKLKNEIKYLASKHSSHIEKMKKITNKAFLYCFIKLFVLIFLSLFTIYYIKNLVSNKRVL
ncbi:transmembrane emp24 domain-containing protein, putative [Hepatocystis sp. ex Piliocolobus tephrosceles]|nr:transmembrane emp24 domain-containing protein, putative [Hepatocystis sp. ex Piliocolobus tephrosceles]